MTSRIVIGDVHGNIKTLQALVKKLPEGIPITFVGDLVDRGPKSMEVVDFVIENGHDLVRGNHEEMMIEAYDDSKMYELPIDHPTSIWMINGGRKAYASYLENGVPKLLKILEHINFFKKCPITREYPEVVDPKTGRHLVVSHSTMTWGNNKEDILWGRNPINDVEGIFNVFGHTPQEEILIASGGVCIDTGCCFHHYPELGRLTAVQYPELEFFSQENIDKEA